MPTPIRENDTSRYIRKSELCAYEVFETGKWGKCYSYVVIT